MTSLRQDERASWAMAAVAAGEGARPEPLRLSSGQTPRDSESVLRNAVAATGSSERATAGFASERASVRSPSAESSWGAAAAPGSRESSASGEGAQTEPLGRSSGQTPRDGETVVCSSVAANGSSESPAALPAMPLGPAPECETTDYVKMSIQFS